MQTRNLFALGFFAAISYLIGYRYVNNNINPNPPVPPPQQQQQQVPYVYAQYPTKPTGREKGIFGFIGGPPTHSNVHPNPTNSPSGGGSIPGQSQSWLNQASQMAQQQANAWNQQGSQYVHNVVNAATGRANNNHYWNQNGHGGGSYPNFNLNQFATGGLYFTIAYSGGGSTIPGACSGTNAQCQINIAFPNSGRPSPNNNGGIQASSFFLESNYTDLNGSPVCYQFSYAQPVQNNGRVVPYKFNLISGQLVAPITLPLPTPNPTSQLMTIVATGQVQVPPVQNKYSRPSYVWVLVSVGGGQYAQGGYYGQPQYYLLSQTPNPPNTQDLINRIKNNYPQLNINLVPVNSQCFNVYQRWANLRRDVVVPATSSLASASYWQGLGQGLAQNAVNQASGAAQNVVSQIPGFGATPTNPNVNVNLNPGPTNSNPNPYQPPATVNVITPPNPNPNQNPIAPPNVNVYAPPSYY